MKGVFLRRPSIVATLALAILSTSVTSVGATTSVRSAQARCGVVANRAVHVVSSGSLCVISVHLGTNVRIRLRSGFRWGYPRSDSRAVVVTTITRDSAGVDGATLRAVAVGRATIRTTGTVYCKSGVACPDLALLWSLKVIVTQKAVT